MNRKKRLEKGIESIEIQIILHEKKKEEAVKEGNIERVKYYEKEIRAKKDYKEHKKRLLEKL